MGALLSHDFRFKMRVWFLESADSVCPGCSTGCNIFVDHRDGEVQRLRPRRNVEVNKSWMCDIGRKEYKEIAIDRRVSARPEAGRAAPCPWPRPSTPWPTAWRRRARPPPSWPRRRPPTRTSTPSARWPITWAGCSTSAWATPERKLRTLEDGVLLRADRNPNTQGCLDQGLARSGVDAILAACASGKIKALILQGPELLRLPEAAAALSSVPFVAVMATHEVPELDRAHVVLPAAMWAEVEGTFTNYQRRVQRIRRAVPAPGEAAAALGDGGGAARAPGRAARRRQRARGLRAPGRSP